MHNHTPDQFGSWLKASNGKTVGGNGKQGEIRPRIIRKSGSQQAEYDDLSQANISEADRNYRDNGKSHQEVESAKGKQIAIVSRQWAYKGRCCKSTWER
ncbi:hypothetical protein ACH5RR_020081 [Cinchona calisaya]|uniref:Uncharacterized protein n=1 Tax=Cinchona calisaya TaxID=153742 RepID=A0ABD2ZGF6_9GENT